MDLCLNIFSLGQAARGSAEKKLQEKGSTAQKVWEPLLCSIINRLAVCMNVF